MQLEHSASLPSLLSFLINTSQLLVAKDVTVISYNPTFYDASNEINQSMRGLKSLLGFKYNRSDGSNVRPITHQLGKTYTNESHMKDHILSFTFTTK